MATLTVPSAVPPVADDCEQLRKAFQGWGTNEALIISILGHRDAAQRRAIRRAYADTYGEELLRSLADEISGDFEDLKADPKDEFLKTLRAVIRCFSCPERCFEKVIRLAIAGMGTDENSLY